MKVSQIQYILFECILMLAVHHPVSLLVLIYETDYFTLEL